jgi:L-amino acid N-acyltransferase YncA
MMIIRDISLKDAAQVAQIYNYYILHTDLTFEIAALETVEMEARIQKTIHGGLPWLVAEEEASGHIIGYAYASPWRDRAAYQYTVATSIYLAHDFKSGTGIGTTLYTQLLNRLENNSTHAVIALITTNNAASTKLHQKLGFEKLGVFREVGWKFNQWISSECWQRIMPNHPSR